MFTLPHIKSIPVLVFEVTPSGSRRKPFLFTDLERLKEKHLDLFLAAVENFGNDKRVDLVTTATQRPANTDSVAAVGAASLVLSVWLHLLGQTQRISKGYCVDMMRLL